MLGRYRSRAFGAGIVSLRAACRVLTARFASEFPKKKHVQVRARESLAAVLSTGQPGIRHIKSAAELKSTFTA